MILTPGHVTLADLEIIYRGRPAIRLRRSCRKAVNAAARVVRNAAGGNQPVYGVNTGFGKLAHTRIPAGQTTRLQRNLILSHCCGVGDPLPEEVVRLVMALKILSLGRGASGVRWAIIEQMEEMLRKGVIPWIPSQGSVGASGDLAPLAHMTAVLIGEGKVMLRGRAVNTATALRQAGMKPISLGPKEGLGMINGTQVSTALALAGLFDAWRLCRSALITGALSSDALMASTAPFREEIHSLRGHRGQIDAAGTLRSLLDGSKIRESHLDGDERVQDPYCLRCQPQVMGACMDLLRQAGRSLEVEANAVTDNPLVIMGSNEILSGGNFHAEPVAFAADQCALAIAEMGSVTERRIATLVDPALNYGLPAFLSPDPGLNSGFMIAEVTAAALMAENRQRAMPCSVDSTPTSANQEDHVSMACHAARRLLQMNRNLSQIVAIELVTASQGVSFRAPLRTSKSLQRVIRCLRRRVPPLGNDRYMAGDLREAAELVCSDQLEKCVGARLLPDL